MKSFHIVVDDNVKLNVLCFHMKTSWKIQQRVIKVLP